MPSPHCNFPIVQCIAMSVRKLVTLLNCWSQDRAMLHISCHCWSQKGKTTSYFLKVYFPKVYFPKVYFPKVYFPKVYFPTVYFPTVYFLRVNFFPLFCWIMTNYCCQVKTGGELDSTSSLENLLGEPLSISPVLWAGTWRSTLEEIRPVLSDANR